MKEAFIKLHISILLAGITGLFGKLISLNEGLLVWYRMMFASLLFISFLAKKIKTPPAERNFKNKRYRFTFRTTLDIFLREH